MKVFLINLEQSHHRLEQMSRAFSKQGIAFERFVATDARAMSAKQIADVTVSDREMQRPLLPSEVGCFLSHRGIWETGVNRDLSWVAVFEDDVHLADHASTVLNSVNDWLPPDADIIKLETVFKKVAVSKRFHQIRPGIILRHLHSDHWGTGGYIVTRAGMKKLLAESTRIGMAVDTFMFTPGAVANLSLTVYQLEPALCVQDQCLPEGDPRRTEIVSEITAEKAQANRRVPPKNLKALGFSTYLRQKLKRRTGKMLAPFIHWLKGNTRRTIDFR